MVRFGIIGAGRLGNVHANSIAAIPTARLVALYDIADAPARAMSEQFGAKICTSAEELAACPEVDAVIVSSPTYCHLEGIAAAVRAGKPVFSEKPITRQLNDAYQVRELVRQSGHPFAVGFVRRHMLKTRMAKELLDSGKLGTLKFCNIDLPFGAYKRMYGDWFTDFDKSGGVIVDMLAHHVDLANWFFGKARRVYAQSMLLDPKQALPSDYVSATVTYESGVIMNLMCSWQRFGRSGELMEIYGDRGALSLTSDPNIKLCLAGQEPEMIDATEKVEAAGVGNASTGNGFVNELTNFIAAVNGHAPEFLPAADAGVASLAVADAMIRSAQTNQVIEL